jgi:hypothetical protein
MRAFAPFIALGLLAMALAACAASTVNEPSLAQRRAEAIDPRVPIPSEPIPGPVDAALASRLGGLVADGKAGAATFDAALAEARRLASAAGPAQSESWIVAQQALSALEAARARTAGALSDIDEIAARRIQSAGGLSASDLAAVEAASAELRAISQRQAAQIDELGARLGR